MSEFSIKQFDTLPSLAATLETKAPGGAATPIVLTGATVKLVMTLHATPRPAPTIVGTAVIVSATLGKVRYDFVAGQTDVAGAYDAEWHITFANADKQKVPTVGFFTVYVDTALAEA